MSNPFFILDVPLPQSQDFNYLKTEGLARIQEYSGSEWTNLNPSDPGITILDQLCYALTELGYCNGFSMADILTRYNGKIHYKDQFYLPEEILTTAPVTLDDYRKYVMDEVAGVTNLVIEPGTGIFGLRVYQVYLQVSAAQGQDICSAVYFCLNKNRNVAEFFDLPKLLRPKTYLVSGRIDLEKGADLNTVLNLAQAAMANYIFPVHDYNGKSTYADSPQYNGPSLVGGRVGQFDLSPKKDYLQAMQLNQVMGAVPGMSGTTALKFSASGADVLQALCDDQELITVDLLQSVKSGLLQVYQGGRSIGASVSLHTMNQAGLPYADESGLIFEPGNTGDEQPLGKYRDISQYYSVQNTFPEVFAVGLNSTEPGAGAVKVAQSRQLKGYLTLFDQLMANQFSQLANLDRLFSFKNSMSGTPSDLYSYYTKQDPEQKMHEEYPVPYKIFSPTYYYQSLYNVPYIKPLLKDHDAFNFSLEPEPEKIQEAKSWAAYTQDPYNAYIHGLMEMMESEETSLERRNTMLDHLLARHGESPLFISAVVDGSTYSGNTLKDQVIFKSLYLQNLGLLSYYRQKAYNYQGAEKISANLPPVPQQYLQVLDEGNFDDSVFNSRSVDRLEKISASDLINYSGIELKLSLLFGLKPLYKDYILNQSEETGTDEEVRLAYWLITQRRGMVFFEPGLLLRELSGSYVEKIEIPVFKDIEIIFPDFVPALNTPAFRSRLTQFLDDVLPVQCSYTCRFVGKDLMFLLVKAYSAWHNSLIYSAQEGTASPDAAKDMVSVINTLQQQV